jgi:hypothetical protein
MDANGRDVARHVSTNENPQRKISSLMKEIPANGVIV